MSIKNRRKSIIINCSNLHVGGGLQVAVSFISHLITGNLLKENITLYISSELARELQSLGFAISKINNCIIQDHYGLNFSTFNFSRKIPPYSIVFTLFGPFYHARKHFKSIVGFAQPWIIYPNNECYLQLKLFEKLKLKLKFKIQSFFFKRADLLVVELDHVKRGLTQELGVASDKIVVINNCLSSIYSSPSLWKDIDFPIRNADLRIGFIGRNYLHKNINIFVTVSSILKSIYKIHCLFYLTFTEQEWNSSTEELRRVSINLGPLNIAQCPNFYCNVDAVVFPSLLECFSATPLEAMAMGVPLFVSDRPFNRDVCGEHANYFDPLSPESAARSIAKYFLDKNDRTSKLKNAQNYAFHFSNPCRRAEDYMNLLDLVNQD